MKRQMYVNKDINGAQSVGSPRCTWIYLDTVGVTAWFTHVNVIRGIRLEKINGLL